MGIIVLLLVGVAFAAGWYGGHPPPAAGVSQMPPQLQRGPDLLQIIRDGDIEAGLDLIGPAGWPVLVVALDGTGPAEARRWYGAFEARYGLSADSQLAIAGRFVESGQFGTAIDLIFNADRLADSADAADDALTGLVDAIESAALAPREVDGLLETVTLAFPEKARFQLLLGELRLTAGDFAGAESVLAQIENHPRFGARARSLRAGVAPATPGGVPLERAGNQFYVLARLDAVADVKLMVDTGAAMTVLSAELLAGLGYDLAAAPRRYFATAGGVVRAPVVRLVGFELGGRRMRDWPVGAIDMPMSRDAAGLLGMDFLSRQAFVIDQEREVLVLGPRAEPRL